MTDIAPLPPDTHRGPGLLVVGWIEACIGTATLVARIYTRSMINRNVGFDDWTMLLAVVLAIVTTTLVSLEVRYGVGRHAVYLDPSDITKAVEMIWLTVPFSTMSACFGKISIALLLMRVDKHTWAYRAFLWSLIVLLFIINLLLTIITFAQCTPVTFLWNRTNPELEFEGQCWDPTIQQRYGYFQGAFSSFSDLVLALFPILIIRKLRLALKVKIGLISLLGLGVIATVASIYKTFELRNLTTQDFTYDATDLVYWYLTENWLIVIGACLPTLGPLYMVTSGKRSRSSYRSSPSSQQDRSPPFSRWNIRKVFRRIGDEPDQISKSSHGKTKNFGETWGGSDAATTTITSSSPPHSGGRNDPAKSAQDIGYELSTTSKNADAAGSYPRNGIAVRTEMSLIVEDATD